VLRESSIRRAEKGTGARPCQSYSDAPPGVLGCGALKVDARGIIMKGVLACAEDGLEADMVSLYFTRPSELDVLGCLLCANVHVGHVARVCHGSTMNKLHLCGVHDGCLISEEVNAAGQSKPCCDQNKNTACTLPAMSGALKRRTLPLAACCRQNLSGNLS